MLISIIGQHEGLLPSDKVYGFPSRYFYEALSEFDIKCTDSLEGDALIAINHNKRGYKKFLRKSNPICPKILIRTEPKSVFPSQYHQKIESKYTLVLSPGRIEDSPMTDQFYQFQSKDGGPDFEELTTLDLISRNTQVGVFDFSNWDKRKSNHVMIASNKYSPLRDSGYSLRRAIAAKAEELEIDIYGMYWDSDLSSRLNLYARMVLFHLRNGYVPQLNSNPLVRFNSKRIKGQCFGKEALLLDTKFLVIVENSQNVLTEKIFDAIIMGAIPIYTGPRLSNFSIPTDLCLEFEDNIDSLRAALKKAQKIDFVVYLETMREYINSDEFKDRFCDINPYKALAKSIHAHLQKTQKSDS